MKNNNIFDLLEVVGMALTIIIPCLILACKLGWQAFAKNCSNEKPLNGKKYKRLSGKFGPFMYSRSLSATLSDKGIFIENMPVVRALHPPFFVKWNSLREIRKRSFLGASEFLLIFEVKTRIFNLSVNDTILKQAEIMMGSNEWSRVCEDGVTPSRN